MLGDVGDQIEIVTVAKSSDPVPSYHGQKIVVENSYLRKIILICCSFLAAIQH